jgi:L-proline amide hydrolase
MTHDYLLDFAGLGADRQIIFYDQIGNGLSNPVGANAAAIVSLDTMVAELEALLASQTDHAGYILLAHSSGGCVALKHALNQPAGLKGLILANAFPSGAMMQAGLRRLRDKLDPAARKALLAGPGDGRAFADAMGAFFAKHVCRVPPPPHLLRTLQASQARPQVQHKLMGPDLFDWQGALSNWTVTDELHKIGVPTLVYGGLFDETDLQCLEVLAAGIPKCQLTIFNESSHLPHIEQTQACLSRIQTFLGQTDSSAIMSQLNRTRAFDPFG